MRCNETLDSPTQRGTFLYTCPASVPCTYHWAVTATSEAVESSAIYTYTYYLYVIHDGNSIISSFSSICRLLRNTAERELKTVASVDGVNILKLEKAIERLTLEGILVVNSITYNTRLATANTGEFPGQMQANIVGKTTTFDFHRNIFSVPHMVSDLLEKCKVEIDKVIV